MAEIVAQYKINVDDAVKSLNKVAEATKKTEEGGNKAGQAISTGAQKGSAGFKKVNQDIAKTKTGLSGVQGGAQKAGTAFKAMGVQLLAALGVTAIIFKIVEGFKQLITVNKNFEFQMAKVQAITGATSEEMKNLTSNAKALGASTKFTATEVAGLQEEYAKLGFSTDEILNTTEATLMLAEATGSDLAQAANIAGQVLRAFKLDALETQRVTDVMALSFSSSALNIENFAESMKYVAPIAATANIPIETTTALLAKLADAGLRGSIAGTGLKNLLTNLSDGSSSLSKKLGFAVTNSEDLFKAFKLLKGGSVDLTEALELSDKRSLAAFLTLIEGADSVKELSGEFDNAKGAAEAMALIMRDTLSGDIDQASAAWEGLLLSLGKTGGIRSTVQTVTQIIGGMTKAIMVAAGTWQESQNEFFNAKASKEGQSRATDFISKLKEATTDQGDLLEQLTAKTESAQKSVDAIYQDQLASRLEVAHIDEGLAGWRLESTKRQLKEDKKRVEASIQGDEESIKTLNAYISTIQEYIDRQKEASGVDDAETQSQINNVFAIKKAIKELEETRDAEGTSRKRIFEINSELITLEEQLAILLGKETEAMKEAREEREKAIKAIEDEAKALRKLLKAKIDAMHDSEEKAMVEALESIEFRFALEKLYTTQSISEADGRSDALLQIEHDRLEAILKARREFGMETIEQEQALADLQAGILDGQNNSGDGYKKGNGNKIGSPFDLEGWGEDQEEAIAIFMQYAEAVKEIASGITSAVLSGHNAEIKSLDYQLESGQISREKYDEKRREIERKKAIAEKNAAIFQAVIATAVGVASALPNVFLAAVAGALGLIQIGVIAGTPLPAFKDGVIGLKGKGTETSDEIPAMLSLNESVMTGAETRKYNAELWAMRNGTFDKLMKGKYSVPKIDASLFSGWGDMGKSAEINGLMATLKDHNIIASQDRMRQSMTHGFKYLAKELKSNGRQKRGSYDA